MVKNELLLSTDMIEHKLRTNFWREVTRPYFDTIKHADNNATVLEGTIKTRLMGSLLIGSTVFNQQQFNRDRRIILQSGLDHYLLQLFLTGDLQGDCNGHTISIGAGDICIFDLAQTFNSHGVGSTISIVLPRERLDKAANGRSLHGVSLKAGTPVAQLLSDFIVSLASASSNMDLADVLSMEEASIDFIASGLTRQLPTEIKDDPLLANVLRRRILYYIDTNLSDPKLDPTLLMNRFKVSRAHLYRMFAVDNGVATVIREKRLNAAYRQLIRPRVTPRLVTEIAYHVGFSSSSQFMRAFRTQFGIPPGEVQQEAGLANLNDERLAQLHSGLRDYVKQLDCVRVV